MLERLLLIYAEVVRRVESGGEFPATLILDTASLFRSFGEDYHEKLEEQYIFPTLERTSQHAGLAKALKRQHDVGRTITTFLLNMTRTGSLMQPQQAVEALRSFHRMYLPHISRENSVAFRAFHSLVPHERYMDLGEQFEVKEHAPFGEDGFDKIVAQVAAMERDLDIHNLEQLTSGNLHTGPARSHLETWDYLQGPWVLPQAALEQREGYC